MLDMFIALAGDVSGMNPELLIVLASLFFLFVTTEFCRFLELGIDYTFRRKK